jgi:transcriptional regulator with XRE-family HTH domain
MDTTTHKRHIGALCQRTRIDAKGWTLYAAEKASGLQGAQIKAIEAGDKDYTIDSLVKYCSALGITIDLTYGA